MSTPPSATAVTAALRRVRSSAYRVEERDGATVITLVLEVSAAGRRNAATHIVEALAAAGFELHASDPVGQLTEPGTTLTVLAPAR